MRFFKTKRLFYIIPFCLLAFVLPAYSAENIAIGKSYTLFPPPNYHLCTDNGDATQLTDGKYSKSHWSNVRTVGWFHPLAIPQVTIDLERVCTIERVDIHTTAGRRGGIDFWSYAVVLVSHDGINFQIAGYKKNSDEIKKTAIQITRSAPYVHSIPIINTTGRFIKIVIQMETKMFFSDEIEIIGRDSVPDSIQVLPVAIKNDFAYSTIQAVEERLELIHGISETQRFIFKGKDSFPRDQLDSWSTDLCEMTNLYSELRLPFISQQQLKQAQQTLGVLRAAVYRTIYRKPFAVIQANPMRQLSAKEMIIRPRSLDRKPSLWALLQGLVGFLLPRPDVTVSLWQKEYESLAFNIINCSPDTLTLNAHVALSKAPALNISAEKIFTLRRAEYVYGLAAGQIADALILLNEKPFEVAPGQVIQVWLTIDSRELAAGKYEALLSFSASLQARQLPKTKIAVQIQVQQIAMPDQMALSTYVWASKALSEIAPYNTLEASKDLQAHHVNVFIVNKKSLPFPENIKAWGRPIPLESYADMDAQLNSNGYARMYLISLGFHRMKQDRGRFGEWMSEAWKGNFKSWLLQIVKHLKKRGLGYESFALYPYDEYIGDDFYKVALLIKEADPRIKIFANSYGKGPQDFMRLKELVDIWCVHQLGSIRHPDWFKTVQSFGKEMWTYKAAGPVRFKNPLDHYRIMPWWAFKHGLTGAGFWVYFDSRTPLWNDYGKCMGSYGVVYDSANTPIDTHGEMIVPSRRWEIWREGLEDYQYLITLRNQIEQVRTFAPEKADYAQHMLERHLDNVLASGTYMEILKARTEITRMVIELEGFER